ncbi:MAG: arginase family protein [Myxococcota bacterium]|nr:arginase family protein [Myxococcota bacterium]
MNFDDPAAQGSGWFGCEGTQGIYALIEAPFDATSSHHRRASAGPSAMRAASHQVELTLIDGRCPIAHGLVSTRLELAELNQLALEAMNQLRAGQADAARRVDDAASALASQLEAAVDAHWAQGRQVVIVGGDHSVSYGALKAALQRSPELGILHLDAHADLRRAYEGVTSSHASIMDRVKTLSPSTPITQVGLRDLGNAERARIASDDSIVAFFDEALVHQQFLGMPWAEQARAIIATLPETVWVSFDVDALDPSLCPHTGTPVPGGLTYYQAIDLLDRVQKSGRTLLGVDLTEVAGDPYDALIGARLVYRALAAFESKK